MLGQWCNQTSPAWSFPHEAADHLLGAFMAMNADWDGLVRRGVFVFPQVWGEGAVGTAGGEDIFQIVEVLNGSPHIYGPVAARGFNVPARPEPRPPNRGPRRRDRGQDEGTQDGGERERLGFRPRAAGYFDTLYTQGVAGWIRG